MQNGAAKRRSPAAAILPFLFLAASSQAQIQFRAHVIETSIPGGYQILAADLNNDERPDVIGLSGSGAELFWYENPSWRRHAIVSGQTKMITIAAADVDHDGELELALGTHFNQTEATSEGHVYLLERDGDPRRPWQARLIDRLPTTHRMRFADVDGDGELELVNAPLTGPGAKGPDFVCETPLVYYEPGNWKRHAISSEPDGVLHGMMTLDWDDDGREDVLTASFGGIDLFRSPSQGQAWRHTKLTPGDPAPRPKGGSSEIRVGRAAERRFLATIEPWHGHQVVVYAQADSQTWTRQIVDATLDDGHVIVVADFDQDGNDEIVAGYRAEGAKLLLFQTGDDFKWRRQVLDDGDMSAAGCDAADLNSDGRVDLVCIGRRTANIKWYENVGSRP